MSDKLFALLAGVAAIAAIAGMLVVYLRVLDDYRP
jgi:hypothetical protein